MSTTTTTITKGEEAETPFLTGARKSGSSVQFWKSYVQARPSPTEDFFDLIYEYHQRYGLSIHSITLSTVLENAWEFLTGHQTTQII